MQLSTTKRNSMQLLAQRNATPCDLKHIVTQLNATKQNNETQVSLRNATQRIEVINLLCRLAMIYRRRFCCVNLILTEYLITLVNLINYYCNHMRSIIIRQWKKLICTQQAYAHIYVICICTYMYRQTRVYNT